MPTIIDLGDVEYNAPNIVWSAIALVSIVLCWINYLDAKRDRAAVEKIGGPHMVARILTADGLVRRDRIRLAVFIWWFFIGFAAAWVGLDNVQRGTFTAVGLIGTSMLLLYGSYMDQHDRRVIMQEIDELRLMQEHAKSHDHV
jgi:hypothetical protein